MEGHHKTELKKKIKKKCYINPPLLYTHHTVIISLGRDKWNLEKYKRTVLSVVKDNDEALECDGCGHWQHRYEAAIWAAARDVMPPITIRGCAFHWTQAVWCSQLDYRAATPMMLLHTKSSGKFSHYHSCLQSISP